MANFQDLTSDELLELMENLEQEFAHRQTSERLRSDVEKVIDDARESGAARTPKDREDFVRPRDVTEAFKAGETTTWEGRTFRSAITPNLCHPRECRTGWIEENDPEPDEQDDDGED